LRRLRQDHPARQALVFSTAQTDVLAVAKLLDYLKAQNITKIAVIYDSNPFGTSGKEVLAKQAPEEQRADRR